MNIDDLKVSIDNYVSNEKPNYAIMINGQWGAGKTFFIEELCKANKNYLYVSLYGVKTSEDINDKIITSLTKVSGNSNTEINEGAKFIGSCISAFTDNKSGSSISSIASVLGSTVKSKILSNISKTIIFDDLERAKCNITDALSCINDFVEHQKLNVIVLSDENQIIEKEDYLKQKEKIFYYTYEFKHEKNKVADIIFSTIKIDKTTFDASKNELLNILNYIECPNLRTLKFAVYSYISLIKNNKFNESDVELKVRFLFPCVVYAIAIRDKGFLNKEVLAQFIDASHYVLTAKKDEEKDEEKNKYVNKAHQYRSGFIESVSAYKIICHGFVDDKGIDNDISIIRPTDEGFKSNIIYTPINRDNRSFSKDIKNGIDKLMKKEIVFCSFSEMFRFCRGLHFIVENHGYEYDLPTLEDGIKKLLDYQLPNFKDNFIDNPIEYKIEDGFIFKLFKKAISDLKELHQDHKAEVFKTNLLLTLNSQDEKKTAQAYKDLYSNRSYSFIDKDVVEELYVLLISADPKPISEFNDLICDRYVASNWRDFTGNEEEYLILLKQKLDNYVKHANKSFSLFQIALFIAELEKIINSK